MSSKTESDNTSSLHWNDFLGITSSGTCRRHETISILGAEVSGGKSVLKCCPACNELFQGDNSSFSQAIQKLKDNVDSSSTNSPPVNLDDEMFLKRLGQVQSWTLVEHKTRVASLEKQLLVMEQKLSDAQQSALEQQQTVRALRRTIQQDLKLIKTMAEQKQQEIAQQQMIEDEHSETSTDVRTPTVSPMKLYRGSPAKQASLLGSNGAQPSPLGSSHHSAASTASNPRLAAQMQFFQRASRARSGNTAASKESTIPEDAPTPSQSSDGVDDIPFQPTPVERRSSYWNEDPASLASNPTKLFASFRGGLLDIPKSPPPPSHDNSVKQVVAARSKVQLSGSAVDSLQMPERGLMRNNSMDGNDVLQGMPIAPPRAGRRKKKPVPKQEISIGQLANQLTSLPLSSRKLGDQSPEQFFPESVDATAAKSSLQAPPLFAGSAPSTNRAGPKASPRTSGGTKTKKPVVPSFGAPPTVSLLDDSESSRHSGLGFDRFGVSVLTMGSITPNKPAQTVSPVLQRPIKDASVAPDITTSASESNKQKETSESNSSGLLDGSGGSSGTNDCVLFSVTAAECQDRYGDVGMYTGTILVTEGLPHRFGTMNYESGRVYSGEWMSGQWNGTGKLLNPNGDTYEGQFVFDARHGKGVYRWDNGDIYTGSFWQDQRNGQGKFCFHNGNVYEGEFCDGMFDGRGRYEFEGGSYEGEWKEGRYHGQGELTYATGAKFTGEFRNSVAHGFGIEVTAEGETRRGMWENGQAVEA